MASGSHRQPDSARSVKVSPRVASNRRVRRQASQMTAALADPELADAVVVPVPVHTLRRDGGDAAVPAAKPRSARLRHWKVKAWKRRSAARAARARELRDAAR